MRVIALIFCLLGLGLVASYAVMFMIPDTIVPQSAGALSRATCNEKLWDYVYTGDPRRFKTPQDRLKILNRCVSITGVVESAVKEADGDYHIRLKLDAPYENMIDGANMLKQNHDLVLEAVCENPVTQRDTLSEGSCRKYTGHIFTKAFIGQHVRVTGAYVTDMEHLWNEIHPVTAIVTIP